MESQGTNIYNWLWLASALAFNLLTETEEIVFTYYVASCMKLNPLNC